MSHAAFRFVLGRALDVDPKALRFETGTTGKPELAGPERGRLHINLSHSGDQALVGFSRIGRIGVDIEMVRSIPDALRIARHHFAPEEVRDLERHNADTLLDAFMGLWTRKEAFAKACGLGLSLPLDSFVVTVPPHRAEVLSIGGDKTAARGWSLHGLTPFPGYVGAVAIEGWRVPMSVTSLLPGWPEELNLPGRLARTEDEGRTIACGRGRGSL
ncbi:MAG: 4'-phosphopantetheinyl transferase superfamily protein [Methylobacterium sp.]|uniref:4'-phosphopantetheinyl transferase family protein n=1 Tax=Methylobacterium sp. TaxID=409 RepID=UPI0025CDDB0E|nr:4'-phosphopantetheinyl transferase superfamily protein [Methylobacterium sp.]MBX9930489.1 4'-phosphopantetheinyl transferase superfamily protein [Methylobacterium sp.]